VFHLQPLSQQAKENNNAATKMFQNNTFYMNYKENEIQDFLTLSNLANNSNLDFSYLNSFAIIYTDKFQSS